MFPIAPHLEFEQQLAKEGAYICCRNFINDFLIAKNGILKNKIIILALKCQT
jgi:hypothetical protein